MDLGKVLKTGQSFMNSDAGRALSSSDMFNQPRPTNQGGFGSGISNISNRMVNAVDNSRNFLKKHSTSQSIDDRIAELKATIEAANPTPVLPQFDSSAARAQARKTAAKTQDPIYQDNLSRYMERKKLRIGERKSEVEEAKEAAEIELEQLLEDSGISRERTGEDAETQLGDINANEDSFQTQEGTQFDRARDALLGGVADAGLTESGIGQGIAQDAVTDRNLESADTVREFDNNRRDVETFKTRTFQDLDKGEIRGKEKETRTKEQQDRALEDFITMQGAEEEQFRVENEQSRLDAIRSSSQDAYQKIVADRLAQLAKQGRSARDINFFSSVYG